MDFKPPAQTNCYSEQIYINQCWIFVSSLIDFHQISSTFNKNLDLKKVFICFFPTKSQKMKVQSELLLICVTMCISTIYCGVSCWNWNSFSSAKNISAKIKWNKKHKWKKWINVFLNFRFLLGCNVGNDG